MGVNRISMERTMHTSIFLAAVLPDGALPGVGRLPCPHCGALHLNPADGSSLWTLSQVKALVAMKASRVCAGCGNPSIVLVDDDDDDHRREV
jgi:hypothetical protein